jgi:hypothetical protein
LQLVSEIKSGLLAELERSGAPALAALVGVDAGSVTSGPWPD